MATKRALVLLLASTVGYSSMAFGQTPPPAPNGAPNAGDPSGRVGRLAFAQGTVSFHDSDKTDWAPAVVNTPLTAGDAVWTEPNAHSEISVSGTQVRMDGGTQLDLMTLDDTRTRLQVDQGRLDIKTFKFDAKMPYEVATPRGVAALEQEGDYYIQAGSTQDPTRLGVRKGAAQFQGPDGRVLAVRAGEVVEVTGDGTSMELHTIQAAPPPAPQYWAERDRVVTYDQPPQYLSSGITGYEDLNHYGTWQNDAQYGQVWYANSTPDGWAPYSTGRWNYEPTYGWTWVDEQPWGFAPYHYGRWAQRENRWFWVPPERSQAAVYAPALVAFIGGVELGQALSAQNRQPVGWFPLGPNEAYIPPYTSNRDYYRRVNMSARIEDRILEERWERRQAIADQNWMNRRYATVVPSETFARSQPVERALIRVSADKLAAAPVAPVAAPPVPTQSIRALVAPNAAGANAAAPNAAAPNAGPNGQRPNAPNQAAPTVVANAGAMQALKPEAQPQKAPGPQVAARTAVNANASAEVKDGVKPTLPKLEQRNASAPAAPQIQGERKPVTGDSAKPGDKQATAPANQPATTAKPGDAPKPADAAPKPADASPKPGEPSRAQQPGQANLPALHDRNDKRPDATATQSGKPAEAPKAAEPPKAPQANAAPAKPAEAPKAAEPPKAPQANATPAKPADAPKAAEPPKAPQANAAPAKPAEAPKAAEPPKAPQANATPKAPEPPKAAEPPHQAQQPQPQQQHLQREPMPSAPPASQAHAAPPPQAAPQVHTPAPAPQAQAPHPAPQPQAAPQPAPHPQPAPQQVQAPHPQPAPQAAPAPAPHPQPAPQQAQAPAPAPHPQAAAQPAPAPQAQPQHKDEKK